MNTENLVSVIIPTYNRKGTLKRAIDSILNQTYREVEIIIVDDGSTDDTYEYINEVYGERDNILYICNDVNIGQSAARNVGVEQANGKWLAFCDSDDEWKSNKLEKQMEIALKADSDIGLVYSAFVWQWDNGMVGMWPPEDWKLEDKQGQVLKTLLLHPLVGIITALMKKEVFIEVGGFNEKLKAMEDYEFTLRVAQSYKFAFVDEILATAYVSHESVGKHEDEKIMTQCYIMVMYREALEKYGIKREKFGAVLRNAETSGSTKSFLQLLLGSSEDYDYIRYAKEYVEAGREATE